MLVVRVETDWFAHQTEFRYVLQPGEGMSLNHTLPIGQMAFVPREEVTLGDGTADEKAFSASIAACFKEKTEHKMTMSRRRTRNRHSRRECGRHAG